MLDTCTSRTVLAFPGGWVHQIILRYLNRALLTVCLNCVSSKDGEKCLHDHTRHVTSLLTLYPGMHKRICVLDNLAESPALRTPPPPESVRPVAVSHSTSFGPLQIPLSSGPLCRALWPRRRPVQAIAERYRCLQINHRRYQTSLVHKRRVQRALYEQLLCPGEQKPLKQGHCGGNHPTDGVSSSHREFLQHQKGRDYVYLSLCRGMLELTD